MTEASPERATDVLTDVTDRVRRALAEREQRLRLDADPGIWLSMPATVRARLAELVRFAAENAPPGCELLLAAARPAESVAVAGAGRIVLRWQVALDSRRIAGRDDVIPIRAVQGTPEALLEAPPLRALVRGFAEEGVGLVLDVLGRGEEIRATLSVPGG